MTIDKKGLRDTQEEATAEELKDRFKAGSIPLQTDFANLIDMAEHGRKAVGRSAGQTGPAEGFTLSETGRLELKLNADGGIKVDANGIGVKAGKGIKVDNSGVSLPLGWGLRFGDGLDVKAKEKGGVGVGSDGVWVIAGNGLQVNESGVGIIPEQTFQKGMVMMFAGTEAEMPKGWALCDGKDGRPDLQDRFVLGSAGFANINKTNNKKVTGGNEDKQFTVTSEAQAINISVTVENTTLGIEHIPAHTHSAIDYNVLSSGYSCICLYDMAPQINYPHYKEPVSGRVTGNTGGGQGHSHQTKISETPHKHDVNIRPPYYTLAFIIKT
ncbi:hypothetical protein [Serratia sp. 2723]|uniref:hypothetical protein n=1 Tax=unclassified Serratia (in: enterobacteria) TaxID=2647522 RepID=UPI003D23B135